MLIHDQKGSMTLETLLVNLLIALLLQLTFPIIVMSVPAKNHLTEVMFFFHQLEVEAQQSKQTYGNRHTLYLEQNNQRTIKISSYGSLVRRQVNEQGHEIVLRDINEFRVSETENMLHVNVMFRNGERYEKVLAYQP